MAADERNGDHGTSFTDPRARERSGKPAGWAIPARIESSVKFRPDPDMVCVPKAPDGVYLKGRELSYPGVWQDNSKMLLPFHRPSGCEKGTHHDRQSGKTHGGRCGFHGRLPGGDTQQGWQSFAVSCRCIQDCPACPYSRGGHDHRRYRKHTRKNTVPPVRGHGFRFEGIHAGRGLRRKINCSQRAGAGTYGGKPE